MSALWRGNWRTRTRIATGLVLLAYVFLHFLNIGVALISPDWADAVQGLRKAVFRSWPGTALLYGALAVHAALALWKLARKRTLRLPARDWVQAVLGLVIPVLLATHVVNTRLAHDIFRVNDTVSYVAGLIWTTTDGWMQALLLLVVWAHGCLGLHIWLSNKPGWQRLLPAFVGLAMLVPAFALAGFMTEGRRVRAILHGPDEEAVYDFYDLVNLPGPAEIDRLYGWSFLGQMGGLAIIAGLALVLLARQLMRPRRSLQVTYVDGPTVRAAPGPTLLEISRANGVQHTALCGGRGRCTTCRVIVRDGAEALPAPSETEARALAAVRAQPGSRLACQVRPTAPLTVVRAFRPDGRQTRAHASQGKEAQLAILFLDMRSFTARTTGQLPYDVVFLLNRFFDAIVPAITGAGGTVDKYLGDGLLAMFELPDAASSARAGLRAARDIGAALKAFNDTLARENVEPVRIGLSLHLGTIVIGEIGAHGHAPRTLIGDPVNAASRLEAQTKEMGVQALISAPVLEAAGAMADAEDMVELTLRGVARPLAALPVSDLTRLQLPEGDMAA